MDLSSLSEDELNELRILLDVWKSKARRNALRSMYYEGKNRLKDLGIAIPPNLQYVDSVVGWPAKAVDTLASRSIFDGFTVAGADDDEDPFELRPLLQENEFDLLYAQAVTSELVHSCSFITVTRGLPGDPDVLFSLREAEFTGALWDHRRQVIRSAVAVTDLTPEPPHEPTEITMYLMDVVITCQRVKGRWVVVDRAPVILGRPPIEPLPFQPSGRRPFGRSRISREVMALADMSQRGALRADILMEFNTAPPRFLMGADDSAFKNSKWTAYMDRILAISKDEDGDAPTFGQLSQLSPQGAITYMQHLAARFAGATGVPLSSLGIVQDNPASAEAIQAAKDDLVTTAQHMNRVNSGRLANVARMGVAVRDGVSMDDLPESASTLRGKFRNPAVPSVVSQSDAMVKQIAAIPWLAETTVALEELGYDESQIMRLLADRRRMRQSGVLDQLIAGRAPDVEGSASGE